jgi:hypothetical protein
MRSPYLFMSGWLGHDGPIRIEKKANLSFLVGIVGARKSSTQLDFSLVAIPVLDSMSAVHKSAQYWNGPCPFTSPF